MCGVFQIWFQNRRCKERRRLKSLGLCSSALRMPALKKTDRDVADVASSTKPAPAPMVMSTTLVARTIVLHLRVFCR